MIAATRDFSGLTLGSYPINSCVNSTLGLVCIFQVVRFAGSTPRVHVPDHVWPVFGSRSRPRSRSRLLFGPLFSLHSHCLSVVCISTCRQSTDHFGTSPLHECHCLHNDAALPLYFLDGSCLLVKPLVRLSFLCWYRANFYRCATAVTIIAFVLDRCCRHRCCCRCFCPYCCLWSCCERTSLTGTLICCCGSNRQCSLSCRRVGAV